MVVEFSLTTRSGSLQRANSKTISKFTCCTLASNVFHQLITANSGQISIVVVLEESPCPRGPVFKSLSLSSNYKSLSLEVQVLENFRGLSRLTYVAWDISSTIVSQ